MKKFVLIGGGEVGKANTEYETGNIDKEIVKMTGKEKPKFLFIGVASSFSDSYYDIMKKIYKELGCECSYLKKKNILNNPDIVETKILTADIIYIGGGDTIKLITEVKDYGIDKLLFKASNSGCVIAGISAGAILLAKSGLSDSLMLRGEAEDFSFVEGLGFLDFSISPHYHKDATRRNYLTREWQVKDKILGIDDCAALKIIDDDISVIKAKDGAGVYSVCVEEGKIIEKEI